MVMRRRSFFFRAAAYRAFSPLIFDMAAVYTAPFDDARPPDEDGTFRAASSV